jgi:hypothetical protein
MIIELYILNRVRNQRGGIMKKGIVAIFILVIFIFPNLIGAKWMDPDWRYRRAVSVINLENDSALVNYPVCINVKGSKQFVSDFSDLRFTESDGKTPINYWIEDFIPGIKAKVWVKVPLIPAQSSSVIYMYYGNLKAKSESNGDKTFLFFDDFNDCDISDWNVIAGNWYADNAFLEQDVYAIRRKILSSYSIFKPVVVKAKLNHITGDPVCGLHIMFSKDNYCENGYYFGYAGINRGGTMISKITDCNVVELVTDSTIQNSMYPNEWLDLTISYNGCGFYSILLEAPDGKRVYLETYNVLYDKPYYLGLWVGDHIGCDDIAVYGYTEHPPKLYIEEEEKRQSISPVKSVKDNNRFGVRSLLKAGSRIVFQNPLAGYVNISFYDISGRLVGQPINNTYLPQGLHSVNPVGGEGIYFIRFNVESGEESVDVTKKVVFIK